MFEKHTSNPFLKEEPPKKRVSTGVAYNPVRVVSCTLTGVREGEDDWFKVNNEEMIGAAIKDNEITIQPQMNEMIEATIRDGKMTQLYNEEVLQTHGNIDTTKETAHESTAVDLQNQIVQYINRSTGKTMSIVIIGNMYFT